MNATPQPPDALARQLLDALAAHDGALPPEVANLPPREALRVALTVRPPGRFPQGWLEASDALFAAESRARPRVASGTLPAPLAVWRGDITSLEVDAIVNAANSELLGCFVPFHACIDNAIHSAAGPRLREECGRLMAAQGAPEATGTAKLTRGYHLPARHVLHTVGPIVPRGAGPSAAQEAQLASCYCACLDLAATVAEVRSVAFCCISTGVFGYPQEPAARVALAAVQGWQAAHPRRMVRVVFNVFTGRDEAIYAALLGGTTR